MRGQEHAEQRETGFCTSCRLLANDFVFCSNFGGCALNVCFLCKVPRLRLFSWAVLVALNHLRNWSEEEDENTRQGLRAG